MLLRRHVLRATVLRGAAAAAVPSFSFSPAANASHPPPSLCQVRCFSIGDVFGSSKKKKEEEEAAALAEAELREAKEREELQRLLDDDSQFEEPALTVFELFDQYWDQATTVLSPFRWFEDLAHYLHGSLGLEWWASIVLMSAAVRAIALPIQLYATRNGLRMSKYQSEISLIKSNESHVLNSPSLSEKERALAKNNYKQQLDALARKGGYAEWKNYLSFVTVVPFGIVFYTIRQLTNDPSMVNGGTLWFTDLTQPDSTLILPAVTFVLMVVATEMQMSQSMPTKSKYYGLQRWGGRAMLGCMTYFLAGNASGVMLGIFISAVTAVVPPLLLRSSAFRSRFDVPAIRAPPRSNIEVEFTGVRYYTNKIQEWMQGATFDRSSLGGGVGQIAHSPSEGSRNISEFKVLKGSKRRLAAAAAVADSASKS